jgi:hypothetical protein
MRKLEAIKTYVRFKRVPVFVRERVVDFYEYVYARIRPAEVRSHAHACHVVPCVSMGTLKDVRVDRASAPVAVTAHD